jgi:hypothetical protein
MFMRVNSKCAHQVRPHSRPRNVSRVPVLVRRCELPMYSCVEVACLHRMFMRT